MPEENIAKGKNETTKAEQKETKKVTKKTVVSRLAKVVKKEKQIKLKEQENLAELGRDPYDILKFVLMTEKSVRQIETQNKLVFIVDRNSGKNEIKAAAQIAFNNQISGVKTLIDQTGRKKAFIKFAKEGAAGEIAIRLGII